MTPRVDKPLLAEEHALLSSSHPWDNKFRYITETRKLPEHKRGILRQTQRYDPYVDVALKSFDPELHESIRGYTRAPGDEWDVYASLCKYDKREHFLPLSNSRFTACYKSAVDQVMSEFRLDAPVVPHWILDVDLVSSTSSGYPRYIRKGDAMDEIRQDGRFHFHHLKRYPLWRCPNLPCTPATRGGLASADEPKTRLVWMYPGAMTACEAVFAQPLIEHIWQQKSDLLLTGPDNRYRIQKYLSLISDEDGSLGIGLDFKSFDTLPCTTEIRTAFSILEQNIHFGAYYDKVNGIQEFGPGKSERLRHAWNNIVEYFIHTPMVLPNGRVVTKHIGVPSGSHFTNLIDSLINRIRILTFAKYHQLSLTQLRTNGDDSAFIIPEEQADNILQLSSDFFTSFFRATVSVDKSCIAGLPSQMHVSGTTWLGNRPFRTTQEWMMLAAYSETYIKEPFDSFQRLFGIGIAGAFRDANYCRFFDYFQSGYDCTHGPRLLNPRKTRMLQHAFGIEEIPLVYKQGSSTNLRLRLLVT
jgi:hypothetical protein